jgi:hypothetical protein
MMKIVLTYILAFLIFIAPSPAKAEKFPPHMTNMAAQLYKELGDKLKGKNLNPERRKILEKSVKTLLDMKIHRWSAKPVKVRNASAGIAEKLKLNQAKATDRAYLKDFVETKGREGTEAALKNFAKKAKRKFSDDEVNSLVAGIDAAYGTAFEKLEKNYTVTTDDGQAVQMKWNPDAQKFFLKVFDDGKSGGEEFASNFTGNVKTALSEDGKDITLDTSPVKNPIQAMTATDIEMMRANILGEWQMEDGTVYKFSATEEKAGDVIMPRKFFDDQIEQAKDKIESIKDTKIFKWKNIDTDKIVKQEKFRRLKEPFEYLGKEYALDGAEKKIAALEAKIKSLEAERDGKTLPSVKRYDPVGYGDMKSSDGSRTITVHVSRPDGHSFSYDDAAFDGRSITARRTYKVVKDFDNERLPKIIKSMLINDGWDPPGWLDLEASVDAETGDLLLEGLRWSLHVTYSSFFGTDFEISSTHTPYSIPQVLKREGEAFEIAEGAAADLLP